MWHHRNTAFGQILGSSGCYQNLMSLKLKLCLNPIHGVQFMKGYLPNPVNCWDTDNSDYVYFYGDNLEIKNNTFLYFLLYQIIHFYVWSQPCDKKFPAKFCWELRLTKVMLNLPKNYSRNYNDLMLHRDQWYMDYLVLVFFLSKRK